VPRERSRFPSRVYGQSYGQSWIGHSPKNGGFPSPAPCHRGRLRGADNQPNPARGDSHNSRRKVGAKEKTFSNIFCEHFWITTSGFFSDTALVCSMMEMGIDRILFSVDYPFAENPPGTEWLKTLPLGREDTEKLLNGNARRLLKL
jgi:hypothetical protein